MVRQRGYTGSIFPVRRLVRRLRPESGRAVYRRVVTLVGEQAQVDWGSFGKVRIGQGTRTVSGFVMVLGYSRALAALFTYDQTLESFLRGHVDAFEALGGAARNLVYDNLRSAVLDRRGAAVQFHPRLLDLAGHYHFAPRPCTPGRGNEKGAALLRRRPNQSLRQRGRRQLDPSRRGEGAAEGTGGRWYLCRQRRLGVFRWYSRAWWRVSVRINAPAARGGLRTVATAAKCHRAPVDSHPVAGRMPTGLQ